MSSALYLCVWQGGMYVLQIMDSYAPSYALLVAGFAEVLTISYVYGKYKLPTPSHTLPLNS